MDGQQISNADFVPLNDPDVNTDDLFELLSNRRRRYVLSYLQSMDDTVMELAELGEWLLTQEADRENNQHDAVAIALHHIHLPKMAECEIIDYNASKNTIRYDRRPDREQRVALAMEMTGDLS